MSPRHACRLVLLCARAAAPHAHAPLLRTRLPGNQTYPPTTVAWRGPTWRTHSLLGLRTRDRYTQGISRRRRTGTRTRTLNPRWRVPLGASLLPPFRVPSFPSAKWRRPRGFSHSVRGSPHVIWWWLPPRSFFPRTYNVSTISLTYPSGTVERKAARPAGGCVCVTPACACLAGRVVWLRGAGVRA